MYLDSPIDRCPVCGEYVLMDETQRECANEHNCPTGTKCPLAGMFTGVEFEEEDSGEGGPRDA